MRCACLSLLLAVLATACGPDASAPLQHVDPSQLYWALTLDHHAVTLSVVPPYDTLRLSATPSTVSGAVLPEAPAPRFISTDADHVQVDSTGLLRAIKIGTRIVVLAVDTIGTLAHMDTVWVDVTDAAPPPLLASLSIHPVPPDSAKTSVSGGFLDGIVGGGPKTLSARATDSNGAPINGLLARFASLNPSIATVDPLTGTVQPRAPGEATILVSATAYGITKADTLPFAVGLPLGISILVRTHVSSNGDTVLEFPSSASLLGVGGDIVWMNHEGRPIDVTFDDPTNVGEDEALCAQLAGSQYNDVACGQGDIPAWNTDTTDEALNWRFRRFSVPGTYHYHSVRYGTTGTAIIQ